MHDLTLSEVTDFKTVIAIIYKTTKTLKKGGKKTWLNFLAASRAGFKERTLLMTMRSGTPKLGRGGTASPSSHEERANPLSY